MNMKCTHLEWCQAEDGHDNDCQTMSRLAVLEREHAESQNVIRRLVREERAAIVAFLNRVGMCNTAMRVEKCEHVDDALRIAAIDPVLYEPPPVDDFGVKPYPRISTWTVRESDRFVEINGVRFWREDKIIRHIEDEMGDPLVSKACARMLKECIVDGKCRRRGVCKQ